MTYITENTIKTVTATITAALYCIANKTFYFYFYYSTIVQLSVYFLFLCGKNNLPKRALWRLCAVNYYNKESKDKLRVKLEWAICSCTKHWFSKTKKDTPQTLQEIWSVAPKLWSLRRTTSGSCGWSLQAEMVICWLSNSHWIGWKHQGQSFSLP